MNKLFKHRYFIAFSFLFYSILSLFVEYLVFGRFPVSESISIFVYFYFLCNFIFACIFLFSFVRIVSKHSLSADADGADELSK